MKDSISWMLQYPTLSAARRAQQTCRQRTLSRLDGRRQSRVLFGFGYVEQIGLLLRGIRVGRGKIDPINDHATDWRPQSFQNLPLQVQNLSDGLSLLHFLSDFNYGIE